MVAVGEKRKRAGKDVEAEEDEMDEDDVQVVSVASSGRG